MDERIVQFIAGLRAAGVRVSLAESADAFRALGQLGVTDREQFRWLLRATLIKEREDQPLFDSLFPLYFSAGAPPLLRANEVLTPDQQKTLEAAMRALGGQLSQLLQMLGRGETPSAADLERAAQQAGGRRAQNPNQQDRLTREMLRQMGLDNLAKQIEKLLERLEKMGLTPAGQQAVRELIAANLQALEQQAAQAAGQTIAQNLAAARRDQAAGDAELLDRPFETLSPAEAQRLRQLVARLAAQLRSRVALRQKKGDGHTLDVKTILRANLRTGGVPFDLHYKQRHLKPKFVLVCDISESMQTVIEFMLRLMYELQDQVAKARSFGFYDHLEEVTEAFNASRPEEAIPLVKQRFPHIPYGTDLGHCLNVFCRDHLDAIDRRTTVIFLGDARNNDNAPRLDQFEHIRRRAKRVVWFNPEPRPLWGQWQPGSGSSDMLRYAGLCHTTHQVSTLNELAQAVDALFG